MVISSEFHMVQYKNDDQREDAPHFNSPDRSNSHSYQLYLNSLKDQLHANLHQKFNHSGVDSERLVLLKKLLLDFVSSFVESHKYYNRNENLHPAYDFDSSQNGHVPHRHVSHGHVSHSPSRSNYENPSEHITMDSHPNANISSNTNNLPSNSHDSAMNLSATINQMIDDLSLIHI